jgi:hypothetical protein
MWFMLLSLLKDEHCMPWCLGCVLPLHEEPFEAAETDMLVTSNRYKSILDILSDIYIGKVHHQNQGKNAGHSDT